VEVVISCLKLLKKQWIIEEFNGLLKAILKMQKNSFCKRWKFLSELKCIHVEGTNARGVQPTS
jgi:hypothetical protein